MSYDHRTKKLTKTAADNSKPISKFIQDMEGDFWSAVASQLKGDSWRCKVHEGTSVTYLGFEGEDRSDFSFDGYCALILSGSDGTIAKLTLNVDHSYRGKIAEDKDFKIGLLTPTVAAEFIKGRIFGQL